MERNRYQECCARWWKSPLNARIRWTNPGIVRLVIKKIYDRAMALDRAQYEREDRAASAAMAGR
jgi:hypothetical protein